MFDAIHGGTDESAMATTRGLSHENILADSSYLHRKKRKGEYLNESDMERSIDIARSSPNDPEKITYDRSRASNSTSGFSSRVLLPMFMFGLPPSILVFSFPGVSNTHIDFISSDSAVSLLLGGRGGRTRDGSGGDKRNDGTTSLGFFRHFVREKIVSIILEHAYLQLIKSCL